jgi:superfamily II DNA helicase RecQ
MITDTQTPKEALSKYFGFSHFKGEQEQIVESILDGNHTSAGRHNDEGVFAV